jgi:general secretion pathway protein K
VIRGRLRSRATGDNRGIALVLTLLAVAIITAMVVEFSYDVYVSTSNLSNWQNAQELSLTARSAVRLGAGLVTEMIAMNNYNPGVFEMSQKIPFPDVDGTISLRIEDENSKFNLKTLVNQNGTLNQNAYDSLVRLLTALQLKPELADRIVYWIDPLLEPELGNSEHPGKGADLDSIDELIVVPGMDRKSYERLRPYVTIYGNGSININGADLPVLLSLSSSIDEGMARNIIRYRKDTPFMQPTDIMKVMGFDNAVGISLSTGYTNMRGASPALICTRGAAFRIIATAQSGKLKRIIDSVIDIPGGNTVLYWKET